MPREIEDGDLQSQDIPSADAGLARDLAVRIDDRRLCTSGSFEAVAELGNSAAAAFAQGGELPTDLKTLRLALFFSRIAARLDDWR